MGVKRAVLVLKKSIRNFIVQRIFNRPDLLARQNQNIVIAHVVGRHAELDALVVIDIFILRVTSVKNNHADVLHVLADKTDKLFQVGLFLFG